MNQASTASCLAVGSDGPPAPRKPRHGPITADSGLSTSQVRAMLREWARWVTSPELIGPEPASCRSIEHNYLPPQCWDAPRPRPPEPDWRIAWRIEAIVRTMPRLDAKVVRVWYVVVSPRIKPHHHHDPFEIAARTAHVGSAAYYAELLHRAEEHIRNRLE